MEVHWPDAFSLYPTWQRHQAAWFSGMQTAFSPQGTEEQGLIQVDAWQESRPGQSESWEHSALTGEPWQL
jgi:hypothetical protein